MNASKKVTLIPRGEKTKPVVKKDQKPKVKEHVNGNANNP